jgi:hypothetical protein
MGALHAILKSRCGSKFSGRWVVMTTTIAGIEMLVLAYSWRQRGVPYFWLTCGNTAMSSVAYRSTFEDDFGNVDYKFLPRPQLAYFVFEYLPLIDNHNKQHQSILGLEGKWLMKCCWSWLVVKMAGMSIVDMHRLYRSEKNVRNKVLCWQVLDEDVIVIKFSYLLCGKIRMCDRHMTDGVQHRVYGTDTLLARIEKDGKMNLPVMAENEQDGKKVGHPIQRKCLIFRKYLKADGSVQYW